VFVLNDKIPSLAPTLYPIDNPLHILGITEDDSRGEEVDMALESEMEQYMLQLAEEHNEGGICYKNPVKITLEPPL